MVLNVYVDDFKLAGVGPLARGWKALKDSGLDIDDPVRYQTYLRCAQREIPLDVDKFRRQVELYQFVFSLHVDVQPSLKSRKTAAGPSAAATTPGDVTMAVCSDDMFDVWSDSVWQELVAPDSAAEGSAVTNDNYVCSSANLQSETDWVIDSVKRAHTVKAHDSV